MTDEIPETPEDLFNLMKELPMTNEILEMPEDLFNLGEKS